MPQPNLPNYRAHLLKATAVTALVAGVLDICSAFLNTYISSGRGPEIVLKYIASGIWGPSAFAGGMDMTAIGLLLHFFIAFCWTALFFIIYPKLTFMQKNVIITGIGYGIFVWIMMNLVVLPLSKIPEITLHLKPALTGIAILIIAIGLPISYGASKFYSKLKFGAGS